MNYFRFSLLQSYISSIKKNKKKAILLINTGIFFSIFAFSSAIITFLIERDISKKQSEILQYQISIKEMSKTIAELEMKLKSSEAVNKQLSKDASAYKTSFLKGRGGTSDGTAAGIDISMAGPDICAKCVDLKWMGS